MIITAIFISIAIFVIYNYINEVNTYNIFEAYNLDIEESVAIYKIEKENSIYITISIGIVWILTIIYILANFIINKRQEHEFNEIITNIKDISNKNYENIFKEIKEGTFGAFQNEIYQTVTKLQEYARILEDERKKLSQYLSDISHQLRTPLLSMNVLVDNLIEYGNNDSDIENNKKRIINISTQLDKMKWLVENLLKMAQLDTKSVVLKKEEINVDRLINEVINNLDILIELFEQKIIVDGTTNTTFVGDLKWNTEAITNIVKNAIEHSKKGSTIYIKYEENIFYTQITIEDNGERNIRQRFGTYI